MSQENVEIVRRVYEAAASRDSAAVFALYDPEVELDSTRLGIVDSAGDIHRGHDGLRSFFRGWHEAWGTIQYDYEELIDAGEHVIAIVTRHASGRASGIETAWFVQTMDAPGGNNFGAVSTAYVICASP